ncbi:MAG: efflux RND transporter periplasmic adaptor subunit [Gammaproteobacteria bacterium]
MKQKTGFLLAIGVIAIVLIAIVAWRVSSNQHAGRQRNDDRALSVATAVVKRQSMPIVMQAVGQVQSEHSVQIRPQVSGVLKQVYFNEGQEVSAGQRLFLIDPAPYAAALTSTKSAWESAKANADRMAPLAASDYVTPQEYQNAQSAADQAEAAYKQAQINLAYTDIRAPISGRTGSLAVKSGNVVGPSDTTPLVVINQMKPILVQFQVPQQSLADVRRYQTQHSIHVFITNEDGSGNLGEGKLVFIDNTVNADTGTVMLKSQLPNSKETLWPGQFVGVRMQLALQPDALVIPDSAIQSDQNGNFVYTVVGGKATIAPVTLDRQVGEMAVIDKGLKPGDVVITQIPRTLRNGLPVVVNQRTEPATPVTASP